MAKKTQNNQKFVIGILAAVDAAGKAAAFASLARTDAKQVRGPKWAWTPAIAAINTFGWIAWFLFGRKGK
ncbi:PLD nuclease N-terminal domain-containing protein [Corynebacterium liangguodongii]|nr:PLD nuclease N-terminal domain-containing protein [Corynebacterium liangguodongii]